ncbi:MAG: glutathione transferase GstA [Pseudomonadota bacterium]
MKLYYSPGACSLAVHIALNEAQQPHNLVKVDLRTHKTESGADFYAVNPRGYVPVLEFDDGSCHTEVAALLQYVGDRDPSRRLIPAYGDAQRFEVVAWLAFISSELHKTLGWLWKKEVPEEMRQLLRDKIGQRFAEIEARLAQQDYLVGDHFTVADAYAFTIINWCNFLQLSLESYPNIRAYLARIGERPAVQAALRSEGLLK